MLSALTKCHAVSQKRHVVDFPQAWLHFIAQMPQAALTNSILCWMRERNMFYRPRAQKHHGQKSRFCIKFASFIFQVSRSKYWVDSRRRVNKRNSLFQLEGEKNFSLLQKLENDLLLKDFLRGCFKMCKLFNVECESFAKAVRTVKLNLCRLEIQNKISNF